MMTNLNKFRLNTWRISLSSAPFYASALVISVLGIFMAIFWTINEYQAYKESIENIIKNYNEQYRERVKEELVKVVDFIEYKRSQADLRIENDLRDKVQSAYSIAAHLYSLNKDSYSVNEIKVMALEVLRPIRWENGNGYYFVGRLNEGEMDLFSDEPFYEGKSAGDFVDGDGRYVISEITDMIKTKGAGLYKYELLKPAFPDRVFSKIAFVKYFKPFDWFIGAGIYSEDLEKSLQQDVVERIQQMRFGNDGNVLGFHKDETIFVHSDERLIGRSITDLVDAKYEKYGERMLELGSSNRGEGYVIHSVPDEGGDHQKMSFVQSYPEWSWILSAGMFMDEMEEAIVAETATYKTISFRNVSLFIIMFVIAVFLLLFAAYVYSRKIESGIRLFTDFFRKAADSKVKIKKEELAFTEFEVLGALANEMVDDRIHKESILQRNELRLDTLIQLGEMEKISLQQKYDFVLKRLKEITQSQGGYLALVNNNQTHLTLCSVVVDTGINFRRGFDSGKMTGSVLRSGLAGVAVSNQKPVMTNTLFSLGNLEPYRENVFNHLDVPIYDGERIVLVCGVCNKKSLYDNDDIRQMTMLLEGLWLHVLKTCSEKEMATLERQVIAISQDERSRIGQDLHDGLCSHLSGVELLSKALEQKLEVKEMPEAEQLGLIRGLIKEAIGKTGQLARGLYPVHVIDQGLEAAFEELMTEVEGAYRVKCSLTFDSDEQQWVDNNVATNLYYIVREAVFNGAKHGNPDNITISMLRDEHHYALRIEDDGKGFIETTTRKGMGLHTMKYRTKAIGATFSIESVEGQGTIVMISGEVE